MPPKQQAGLLPSSSGDPMASVKTIFDAAKAPENRTVVTALGMFVAGVAFLHSGWGEVLLPPAV